MTAGEPGKKVVGIGLAVVDHLLLWRDTSRPVEGNKVLACEIQGGGMVGTALVAVTRLGGRAEFWGTVGSDWAGRWVVESLDRENVDTSQVVRVDGWGGPLVVVCVDRPTGQRHFLHSTGLPPCDRPIGSPDRLADAGCLLVDHTHPRSELPAARAARRLGVPVVADLAHIGDDARELLALVDYAICSEGCAGGAADDDGLRRACEAVGEMGPTHVVVTLGDRGLAYLDGGRFGRLDAFKVDVVDTTGAGDTFHGAFCCGLVCGLALDENLLFASATAALKCRCLGGRAGIPTRDEVLRFLAERGRCVRMP